METTNLTADVTGLPNSETFKYEPQFVKAVRWNNNPHQVISFLSEIAEKAKRIWDIRINIGFFVPDNTVEVNHSFGKFTIEHGAWIVDLNGKLVVFDNDEFHQTFKEVE